MPTYNVDFSYDLPEWGTITLEADSLEEANEFALSDIQESYVDIKNIMIDKIQEVKV